MNQNLSKFVNKALIDENADLEFEIKDKVLIGKPHADDFETDGIGTILLKQFNNFPNHVGQINVQTGEKTTFAEFKDRSIRCALWLRKQGIGKGDVVSLSTSLQNDDYVPVLATIFVGAIINSWYNLITPSVAEYFFKTTKPKIMFAWAEGIDMLVSAAKNADIDCKFVVFGKHPDYPSLRDLLAEQDQKEVNECQHFEPEDPKKHVSALVLTSGTTCYSKAAMWSYDNLKMNKFHYSLSRTHSNILIYSTFAWNTGLTCYTMCIRKLLTRILHSEFDPEKTAAVIEKFQVHQYVMTPSMAIRLNKSGVYKKYDFSKLENIFIGGCKISYSVFEDTRKALPNTLVVNRYGITETCGLLSVQTKKCQTKNSIGRILGSVQLKIIDLKSGRTLGANQEGEMCFKINNLMIGYLNNPEETKNVIDDEGWYHSGDLGYYDENGEIWITDRINQLITVKGYNLSCAAIEDIILQHPGVEDAAVVPVPHETEIEVPFAFVVKTPGAEVTPEELIEVPAKIDSRYRICGGVTFINEIPYNSNGKKSIKDLLTMVKACIKI